MRRTKSPETETQTSVISAQSVPFSASPAQPESPQPRRVGHSNQDHDKHLVQLWLRNRVDLIPGFGLTKLLEFYGCESESR
ncbi:MAG: hypothetical protein LBT09_16205 [Planctomycetaceae bacterium]|nr:hypothetical protein [Planctomycetaceae bacterium]